MPGNGRTALPLTMWVHDTVAAGVRANNDPTSSILAEAGMVETNPITESSNTVAE